MIVIKAPAGFDPTWPAIPVNQPRRDSHVDHYRHCNCLGDSATCCRPSCECTLDLAALLGPKGCERCEGTAMQYVTASFTIGAWDGAIVGADGPSLKPCLHCIDGKVPQRVALAIETPCETCSKEVPGIVERVDALGLVWDACPDCVAGVRLRVEYTAQVDAVVPIEDISCDQYTVQPSDWSLQHGRVVYVHDGFGELTLADRHGLPPIPDIDMSHLIVLADWSPGRVAVLISDVQRITRLGAQTFVRPFDGPVAELSEVLA